MNCYGDLVQLKADLGITATTDDTRLLAILVSASRVIDNLCGRTFYVETATKYFDAQNPLFVDDLLSVTTLKTDEDNDGTYENTLTENTDFYLYPLNRYPKTRVKITPSGSYGSFGYFMKGCEIIGLWGYGSGISATPYTTSGDSVQDASGISDTITTITVTDADNFSPGQTILIQSEQCYISAYDTTANTLTVIRAVNGTTGATHAKDTAIYIYDYPKDVEQACLMIAEALFETRGKAGMKSERLGDYSYTMGDDEIPPVAKGLLVAYRKLRV